VAAAGRVSETWIVDLEPDATPLLGPLRLDPALSVGLDPGGSLLLRAACPAEGDDPRLLRDLRRLPARGFYDLTPQGLVPWGAQLPLRPCPDVRWIPLRAWLACQPGSAAWAAPLPDPVAVRLVRSSSPAGEASLLRCAAHDWCEWAESAPAVRLDRLRVAFDQAAGLVLAVGHPLPPIPGERFVVTDEIAAPCGWTWQPGVHAGALHELLGSAPGDLVLLRVAPDDRTLRERVRGEALTPATRAGARALRGLLAAPGGEERGSPG
jgi:MoxR-vWA-beta-propeller ternary system domain bpX2